MTALVPSARYDRHKGRRHKTVTDYAQQMLVCLRRWLPDRDLVVVADGSYAKREFLRHCQSMSKPVVVVTKLRKDASRYQPAPPQRPGQIGRDRRQLVLPVATTIFAGRYGVIIRYGGTVDYRPTNQAIEAETYGRQDTGNGSGQGWDERAFSAQVAERPIAVAGETGASVAHPAGSLRRGVGG